MAVCHYHSDRPGIGICMRCRVVICSACCTRLDGVNHCHACLKALAQPTERPLLGRFTSGCLALLLLGVAWCVFFGIAWAIQGRLAP